MNRLQVKLATTAAAASLLFSNLIAAQVGPYSPKQLPPLLPTAHVRIMHGPELEQANVHDNSAIIRWTTNNPGGTDDHDGIVHYGTNPKELTETAKTPNRLNRSHSDMIFRVRLPDLPSLHPRYPRRTQHRTVVFSAVLLFAPAALLKIVPLL